MISEHQTAFGHSGLNCSSRIFFNSLMKSESSVVIVHGLTHWVLMPICFIHLPTVRSEMISPDLRNSPVILGAPYYTDRQLDRNKILSLSTCQFMNTYTNIIIDGFTGSGKTFLACALGKSACKLGYRTRYIRMPLSTFRRQKPGVLPYGQFLPSQ